MPDKTMPSKKEPKYVETHFRLEPDAYERLRKFCFDNKISMSLVVRQAVEKYLAEAEANTKAETNAT